MIVNACFFAIILFFSSEDEFDVEELSDLLSRVIEISKEVVMVANKAAEACPNRLPKQVLLENGT